MDPILGVIVVVWFFKVMLEDGWSGYKGTDNPRVARRQARQKHRSKNRLWGALVNYLGDVAEDAREEATRAREEKRAREDRERHQVIEDLEEPDWEIDPPGSTSPEPGGPGPAEPYQRPFPDGYNPDPADPSVVDMDTPPPHNLTEEERHHLLNADECDRDICPFHGKPRQQQTQPEPTTNPYANTGSQGAAMAIEIKGLDPAIDYAKDVASSHAEHGTAGNEGYLGALTSANVTGPSYDSAAEAQEASSIAAAKWEKHAELMTEHKRVQEAQDQTPDAGTQEFNQGGR